MEKEDGVKKVAAAAAAPEEVVAVAEPEEATPTLTAKPTLTAPLPAPEKVPEMQEKCYKKTVGEEATFLEIAKDYFNQFKDIPAHKHWICLKNYLNQKCGSVFGKQKVEPVVKDDETPEVVAKPATAPVESN